MLIVKATCTNCGAPLSLADGQRHVICAYCDVSLMVDLGARPGESAVSPSVSLSSESVSADEIRHVKQLIFQGKRAEAVQHYARTAGVASAEAELAVTHLLVPELFRLYRDMPINGVGLVVVTALIVGAAGGATFGVMNASEGAVYVVLAVVGALLCLLFVRWLIPKLNSALVCRFGARGRARVVKRSAVHTFKQGHVAALLLFEVHPAGSGPSFFDEEPILVRAESLAKLDPGNVVLVRYDEPRRRRVFPESPITVVGT